MSKVNILGVNVDTYNIEDSAERIILFTEKEGLHTVYTPNSEIIMMAYQDPEFCRILNSADLLTADGIGVVYASRILGKPIPERAAGYDIARKVLDEAAWLDKKIFLFGSKPGVAEEAAKKLFEENPLTKVVGTRNGYFKPEEEDEIINEINNSGADILLVGLGAPAQEKWIARNADRLKVKVAMGVGGTLDVIAGRAERAPKIFCEFGLEWFYRLVKEPWRAKRMTALPKFALTVILKGRKFK